MIEYSSRLLLAVLVLACVVAGSVPGCSDADTPKVYPAGGTVRYQGKPLEGAMVVFTARQAQPQSTLPAVGQTDKTGHFELKTRMGAIGIYHGAVAGTHRVTISKFVPPNGMPEADYQKMLDADVKTAASTGVPAPGQGVPAKVQFLAPKYSSNQKTTLTAEVQPNGQNDFTFELK